MSEQRARLLHINLALAVVFALVALALTYWSTLRSGELAARDDNPRVVEAELRIRRGRILDINDRILAVTEGPIDDLERRYPIPEIGPAVGYYSLRYGTAGVERSLDAVLRGATGDLSVQLRRVVLHAPQVGRDVRLTLNTDWQVAATSLLEGLPGAALVMSLPDGAIRVLASQPGYDPNLLDESFEVLAATESAPLVNRVTQGQYQPGMALQPLILAALLDNQRIVLSENAAGGSAAVAVNGSTLSCLAPPPDQMTLADALAAACPAAMVDLADETSAGELSVLFQQLGLTEPPALSLVVDAPEPVEPADLGMAILGQDTLVVTPLQLAMGWMALANGGLLVQPRLVAGVVGEGGEWESIAPAGQPRQVFSEATAQAVLDALPRNQDVVEHVALALTGPEGSTHAWYLAAAPASSPQTVVVVILEEGGVSQASAIGRAIVEIVSGRR